MTDTLEKNANLDMAVFVVLLGTKKVILSTIDFQFGSPINLNVNNSRL